MPQRQRPAPRFPPKDGYSQQQQQDTTVGDVKDVSSQMTCQRVAVQTRKQYRHNHVSGNDQKRQHQCQR